MCVYSVAILSMHVPIYAYKNIWICIEITYISVSISWGTAFLKCTLGIVETSSCTALQCAIMLLAYYWCNRFFCYNFLYSKTFKYCALLQTVFLKSVPQMENG